MKYQYLFGPVSSRRLGISLGLDLVKPKTCSLNCLYCEAGKTTDLTLERREYIPMENLFLELEDYLKRNKKIDYITFSGAGEPTLNLNLGKIISGIKERYPQYKIALITNGTLFYVKEVREEIKEVDLIMPSLDAVSTSIFQKVNRPVSGLDNQKIIEGLIALREEFRGQIWLEYFLVPGINDDKRELTLLKEAIGKISPNRLQLNTLDRPGTEKGMKVPDRRYVEKIRDFFQPLPVEIIVRLKGEEENVFIEEGPKERIKERILETLKRRPLTLEDVFTAFSSKGENTLRSQIENELADLTAQGEVVPIENECGTFYVKKEIQE